MKQAKSEINFKAPGSNITGNAKAGSGSKFFFWDPQHWILGRVPSWRKQKGGKYNWLKVSLPTGQKRTRKVPSDSRLQNPPKLSDHCGTIKRTLYLIISITLFHKIFQRLNSCTSINNTQFPSWACFSRLTRETSPTKGLLFTSRTNWVSWNKGGYFI